MAMELVLRECKAGVDDVPSPLAPAPVPTPRGNEWRKNGGEKHGSSAGDAAVSSGHKPAEIRLNHVRSGGVTDSNETARPQSRSPERRDVLGAPTGSQPRADGLAD